MSGQWRRRRRVGSGGGMRGALLLLLFAAAGAAQRFGDRLAPRRPAPLSPRHAAPRASAGDDYDSEEYDSLAPEADTEPPHPNPATRRPARTEAHRLEMSTEYFALPPRSSPSPLPSSRGPLPVRTSTTLRPAPPLTDRTTPEPPSAPGALRQEPWAVPVLALACVLMALIGAFEAFVVWGARHTAPSRRHLLLGQTLLLGLFSCAATAALYAAPPTAFTCGAVRFGTGVSYAIVFASLLVKCVFLLSLNGGVYLPAAYQGLLLFFAVMIQVAIGAQWLGGAPARAVGGRCEGRLAELLLSLCYAAFLVAVVCGVALRSRGIRDNYREATHILAAGGAAAAVWVCWVAAALAAAERARDACVAAGLLGTSVVVFALMFAPKGRRLAALGREGRWSAEREEVGSSLGAGGSGYSPSFFHFKPVKYGMVSAAAPAPMLDRKEPPAQPADGTLFAAHAHARPYYPLSPPPPPPHYPLHPLMHYYSYPPYHYLLPPGVIVRPEEGNVYTSVEPTFSSNPNVFFQRTEPLHVGMMY